MDLFWILLFLLLTILGFGVAFYALYRQVLPLGFWGRQTRV